MFKKYFTLVLFSSAKTTGVVATHAVPAAATANYKYFIFLIIKSWTRLHIFIFTLFLITGENIIVE